VFFRASVSSLALFKPLVFHTTLPLVQSSTLAPGLEVVSFHSLRASSLLLRPPDALRDSLTEPGEVFAELFRRVYVRRGLIIRGG